MKYAFGFLVWLSWIAFSVFWVYPQFGITSESELFEPLLLNLFLSGAISFGMFSLED